MGTGWNTLGLDNTDMSWVFIIARTLQLYCTLVLEVLLDFSPHERAVKRQMWVAKQWERKTSGPHVHWETEGHYFRTSDWIFPELFVSRLLVKGTMTLKTRLEWDKECYGKTLCVSLRIFSLHVVFGCPCGVSLLWISSHRWKNKRTTNTKKVCRQ